ncbi:MAG TPA: chromate efflux transporter [Rubrobacteraceae bacterium]|nr:chromate efflux transporter [Rubrobacteraceae bacterium]
MDSGRGRSGGELRELVRLFLKLGFLAFGGPAAHIAMMHEEVVTRRKWMDDQEFLDLVGATNLIPGPNSTELAIHLGRVRAGWRGLLVAGACFIVPAALIVLAFAVLYARYGSTPEAGRLLYGIIPVIIAVIAQALWGLLKTAVKGTLTATVGVLALILYLLGIGEIPLLATGAATVLLARVGFRGWRGTLSVVPLSLPLGLLQVSLGGLSGMFFSFLKIGAVLFGSGYVLLAFLRTEFIASGRLTEQQLLDAVAVGQFTPGPVFTTATFIGHLLEGVPGAVLATVGIFLPAFIFVASTGPIIPRLRRSTVMSNLLDGLNVTYLALMAGVTWQLGRNAIVDPFSALLALAALFLLIRFKVNTAWLVIGGGALGFLYRSVTG